MPVRKNAQTIVLDDFIHHARYKLTAKEQKLLVHLALHLKSGKQNKNTCEIPVSELLYILDFESDKKKPAPIQKLDKFLAGFLAKQISFQSVESSKNSELNSRIRWISGILVKNNEESEWSIEFGFSPQVTSYLSGLQEKINNSETVEVTRLKSSYSIFLFHLCQQYQGSGSNKEKGFFTLSLGSLKKQLGIEDKYPDFRNFRRKVLEMAKKEINANTRLQLNYKFKKEGRQITLIEFEVKPKVSRSKEPIEKAIPVFRKTLRFGHVPEAMNRAMNQLTDYGLAETFVQEELPALIKGSELRGYEDFFVYSMINFFEAKTNAKTEIGKIKALSSWIKNGRFQKPGVFAMLTEQVVYRKKRLSEIERQYREQAKGISSDQFRNIMAVEQRSPVKHSSKPDIPGLKPKEPAVIVKKVAPAPKLKFDFEVFKKENSKAYRKIRKEREAAFMHLSGEINYKLLLENSIKSYCESWYKRNLEL